MSKVLVVDSERRPLSPTHPGYARLLLTRGYAAVWRRYPFTIILRQALPDAEPTPLRVKIDPGSHTTGLAIVDEADGTVVWAGELDHRGDQVQQYLQGRAACRRGRRQRHTRYRPPRFSNRRRAVGWLSPSLASRVHNVVTWVERLCRWCPIGAISLELAKFDTHLLQNAEIAGPAYQQGELAGYEIHEYLLEKFQRSRHGSDRVSNLVLACHPCNQDKGNRTAAEYGHPEVQALAKAPLHDAAAVNTTRWALYRYLVATDLPIETGTGGRTKWNRTVRRIPKTHWLDAACVGASTSATLRWATVRPLHIQAMGRHSRQMCRTNACGFPDKAPKATSVIGGFRTGDIVRVVVPASSAKAGVYVGRLAIRATGSCNLKTAQGTIHGIHVNYCQPLHRGDGYAYANGAALPPQA
jgi:hypothetical protein